MDRERAQAAQFAGVGVEDGGTVVAAGQLRVPAVAAGGTGRVPFPPALPAGPAAPQAERWLTSKTKAHCCQSISKRR